MERITLSFDTSESKLDYDGASDLRHDISTRLDQALRTAKSGKWVGGLYTKNVIEIFVKVDDYQQAIPIIQDTLKDDWLLPLMEIKRRPDQSSNYASKMQALLDANFKSEDENVHRNFWSWANSYDCNRCNHDFPTPLKTFDVQNESYIK